MSIALARKYRPRNFATVAVQSHVANTLKGAIARGRVAHGYLLCGPRGTGKTTLARVLAMALNCERHGEPELQGEPCGECESCVRIWSGSASLDVVEIDAASNRGVDDARELRERAMYAPSGDDRYKVYIVDEAHMLTREAWNALLKILEEPPPRVVFVFATTEPQKIAQAAAPVLSRLQRFDLKRIGPLEIRERLAAVLAQEGVPFEPEALSMIARAADGGLRDALSLADQVLSLGETAEVTSAHVRTALGLIPDEEYLALLDIIASRRAADVFPTVQNLADAGVDFALVLSGMGDLFRAQLALELGGAPAELPESLRLALEARKGRLAASDLLRMLHALLEMEPMFRRSGQQQLLLETLLVRFALLDRTVELEEVLKGFGSGASVDPPQRAVLPSPVASTAAPVAKPVTTRAVARAVAPATDPPIAPAIAPATAPVTAPAKQVLESQGKTLAKPLSAPVTLERIQAEWNTVSEALRAKGRILIADAIMHLKPVALSSEGSLTVEYDPADDAFGQAASHSRRHILEAIRDIVGTISAITVRQKAGAVPKQAEKRGTKRLTPEDARRERTERLASRSALLESAIKTLDLELMD